MSSLLRFNAALTARNRPLTGDTKSSFVLDDHMGWLKCDGRALDKVAYNLLFQVVGFQFGGSGNTFNLPDLQGRVMGNTGFVTDENERTRTFAPGTSTGELDHKLIQSEMPSHNHDIDGAQYVDTPVTANGNTSLNETGITIDNNSTGITDDGHTHPNISAVNSYQNRGVGTLASANVGSDYSSPISIGTGYADINDPTHNHNITDPTHRHQIKSNGGDQYHNNIQPTLFYGNTFIYCGIPIQGKYPFTTGRNPVLI